MDIFQKIRQREGAVGVATTAIEFCKPIFLTMKMTFNVNKFWYGVR